MIDRIREDIDVIVISSLIFSFAFVFKAFIALDSQGFFKSEKEWIKFIDISMNVFLNAFSFSFLVSIFIVFIIWLIETICIKIIGKN